VGYLFFDKWSLKNNILALVFKYVHQQKPMWDEPGLSRWEASY
jgi:hypothetical protein